MGSSLRTAQQSVRETENRWLAVFLTVGLQITPTYHKVIYLPLGAISSVPGTVYQQMRTCPHTFFPISLVLCDF